MTAPRFWKQATRELAAADPVLRKLITSSKGLALRSRGDAFNTLARSIVGQQISVKAAQSVWNKLVAAVPEMHPEVVRGHDADALRACGLSRGKVIYLHDLAHHFAEGKLSVERWEHMSNEELIMELTQVRGIGRWTAEMFLMFELRRLDVWPVDDLGVRQGYGLAWRLDPPPRAKELLPLGDRFRPYRSVVARYCWEAVYLFRGGTDPSLR